VGAPPQIEQACLCPREEPPAQAGSPSYAESGHGRWTAGGDLTLLGTGLSGDSQEGKLGYRRKSPKKSTQTQGQLQGIPSGAGELALASVLTDETAGFPG